MPPNVLTAWRTVLERLAVLAAEDAELRAGLRTLAKAFISLAEEPVANVPVASSPEPAATADGEPQPMPAPAAPPGPEAALPAADGAISPPGPSAAELAKQLFPVVPSAGTIEMPAVAHGQGVSAADLPLIEARCKLKAEGTRWAVRRRKRLAEGADLHQEIEPRDRDLIERAKSLPRCYLWWVRHRHEPMSADSSLHDNLASCFDAAAYAAAILATDAQGPATPELFAEALCLAAEAQSAVRAAITDIGEGYDDDQLKLFIWVRETASARGVWISRYMRQDDPADPTAWSDLLERLHALEIKLQHVKGRDKRLKKLVSKIRYHVKRVRDAAGTNAVDDWQTIIQSVETMLADGVRPSNVELRELLLPIYDELPDAIEPPKGFNQVQHEIERFDTSRPTVPELRLEEEPSPEVRQVAELLAGRSIVLIGGDKRPQAAEALRSALGLRELIWIEGRDQSYTAFEPQVAHPDVVLVVLAIRWSRHGFSEVKAFCDKYEKPLARLPGGYNPNQVAHHILSQVGNRLAEKVLA